jgi:hypothetical protein
MALTKLAPTPWITTRRWLAEMELTALQRAIVMRAVADDGELERPLGSNRSPYIDEITRWAGLRPPQYWCAVWVGKVFADAGAVIPIGFPACDAWLPYMVPLETLTRVERIGCAVLYGVPGDAKHIGIITRCEDDITLTTEGNRGYAASGTNNGVCVDTAPLTRKDVLGVVRPRERIS